MALDNPEIDPGYALLFPELGEQGAGVLDPAGFVVAAPFRFTSL